MYSKGEWKAGLNPGVTGATTPAGFPVCGGRDWPYRTVNIGTETIAIIPAQDANRQVGKRGIPDKEAMIANANLIASAPLLYEALVWFQEWNGDRKPDGEKPNRADVTRIVKQALSRAEGK